MPSSASSIPQLVEQKTLNHLSYQELDILHSLRGLCAFYVVIFHAKYVVWAGSRQFLETHPRASWHLLDYVAFGFDLLSSSGYEMVIFFFVLSGFFIRYAQLKKHRKPWAFYQNRAVRIYPPYLAATLLACLVLGLVAYWVPNALTTSNGRELNSSLLEAWQGLRKFGMLNGLRTLFFLKVGNVYAGYNQVYWSLLPEALFYLLVPLAFWRVRAYYVLSALAYVVGLTGYFQVLPAHVLTSYFLTYNFYFALGALLYDVVLHTPWLMWTRRVPGPLLLLAFLALFGGLIGLTLLKIKVFSGLMAAILAVFSMSVLLAGKVARQNPFVRLLHTIGIFSFSLYLYHFPLLVLSYAILVKMTGELIFYTRYYWLVVVLVTVVCYALYWVTERVFVNYFRRI